MSRCLGALHVLSLGEAPEMFIGLQQVYSKSITFEPHEPSSFMFCVYILPIPCDLYMGSCQ